VWCTASVKMKGIPCTVSALRRMTLKCVLPTLDSQVLLITKSLIMFCVEDVFCWYASAGHVWPNVNQ
jgi:hypothetical protein